MIWTEFLNQDNHTEQEWITAKRLSQHWSTCAVSELDVEFKYGRPANKALFKAGRKFNLAIYLRDISQARYYYGVILSHEKVLV